MDIRILKLKVLITYRDSDDTINSFSFIEDFEVPVGTDKTKLSYEVYLEARDSAMQKANIDYLQSVCGLKLVLLSDTTFTEVSEL